MAKRHRFTSNSQSYRSNSLSTRRPNSFMETALNAVPNKALQLDYYELNHEHKLALKLDSKTPLLFDLYGNRQNINSLILTESDLLEFLIHMIRREPPLPQPVRELLARPDATFLFVGFGFQKWHARILLRSLQASLQEGSRPQNRSFALESEEFFSHHDLPQTMVFFTRQHMIGFRLFSWKEFIAGLKQHHEVLVKFAPKKIRRFFQRRRRLPSSLTFTKIKRKSPF